MKCLFITIYFNMYSFETLFRYKEKRGKMFVYYKVLAHAVKEAEQARDPCPKVGDPARPVV